MKRLFLAVFLVFTTVSGAHYANACDESYLVRKVLDEQKTAWNTGDIEGFMQGYWKSSALRFASGGDVTYGWAETLKRYKAHYPDRSAMGVLEFDVMEVEILSENRAYAFGRWSLVRENDNPGGLFTLMFRKIGGQWKIVSDHTSSN